MNVLYAAVIVTLNPSIELVKTNAESLIDQGFQVIIIDNHSDNVSSLKDLEDVSLITLSDNKGVAHALNIGMKEAESRGITWVLSLDQDSVFDTKLLKEYLRHLHSLASPGALTPRIIKRSEKEKEYPVEDVEVVDKCPTSGFFLSVKAWNEVGPYDDWMFIDFVDYDMCMRLRIHGYQIYRINTTYLVQELGRLKIHVWIRRIGDLINSDRIRNFSVTYNHSPFRNYYYVRNGLFYINKYKKWLNVSYERKHLVKWETKKILLEPNKIKNIKAIILATRDYRKRLKDTCNK